MSTFSFLYFVHKGIHALLFHSFKKLQQLDITIEEEAEEIFQVIQEVVLLVEVYHEKETRMDDAIKDYEPSVVLAILSWRRQCQPILHELSNSINSIHPQLNNVSKRELFNKIVKQFKMLVSAELKYLPLVSESYNTILNNYYNWVGLYKMQLQVIQSTGPWIIELFEKWIINSITNTEAKAWLNKLRTQKSKIPYQSLNKKLLRILPESRYAGIINSIKRPVSFSITN